MPKILVAFGIRDLARTVQAFLTRNGYDSTIVATTTAEARRELEGGSIELLICDTHLGNPDDPHDESGVLVAEGARRMGIPVILTSPSFLVRDPKEYLAANCATTTWLMPSSFDNLIQLIKNIIG